MVAALISLIATSCTKDFEETNTNPNASPTALPQQLLPPALVGAMGYLQLRNRNFNNELMQVTVEQSDAEGKVFRYDFRSNWADYLVCGVQAGTGMVLPLSSTAANTITQWVVFVPLSFWG